VGFVGFVALMRRAFGPGGEALKVRGGWGFTTVRICSRMMIHRQRLSAVPPKTASLSLEEPGQTRRPFIVQDENCRATTDPREPTARQLSAEGSDHLDIQRPDSAQDNTERRARTQDMWLTHRIPRTKLQIPQAGWTTEFRWVPDHEGIKGNEWM
jgi:hypothetical protein